MKILLLFLFLTIQVSAKEYNLTALERSYMQNVGVTVLPFIYQKLGLTVNIQKLSAGRAELDLKNGLIDGEVLRVESYGDSNSEVIRVPTPYYQLKTIAYIRADSGMKINEISDLNNYVVAKVRGKKHAEIITEHVNQIHDSSSVLNILQQLAAGLVDVAITNKLDGEITTANTSFINNLRAVEIPFKTSALYHYLHKKHADLVPQIDQVIKNMIKSGELKKLINQAENNIIEKAKSELTNK